MACNNILRRFKRNGITFLIVILIYFLIELIESLISNSFISFISQLIDINVWCRIFLLGDFSFLEADPLWFMVALLYSYIILYFLHKFKVMKYAYYLLPIFLLFRIFVECYVNTYNTDWHYSSFFLASGFPIMLLGSFIANKKDAFLKAPLYLTIILTIVSITLMFISIHERVAGYDVAQIFKIWCMVEIFILALKLPGKKEIPILSMLGRKYSSYIYLFHFLVGIIVLSFIDIFNYPEYVYELVMPIWALVFGILIPILLYELNNILKRICKKKKV